jgi:uncharacterized protein involved in exopolysaccharide biosynthesis/Mrp family chromosome partitioning ATPase
MNGTIETRGGNQLKPRLLLPVRTEPGSQPPPEDRLDLRSIYYALLRQLNVILAIMALFFIGGVAMTALQTPQFMASSQVVLTTDDVAVVPRSNGESSMPALGSDIVDTQVEVMRSRELSLSVAKALHLDKNPRFNPAATNGGKLLQRIKRAIGLGPPPVAPNPNRDFHDIVSKLIAGLTVQRVGETYAFNILMTASDPKDAQAIANEYANQYTLVDLNRKRDNSGTAAAFLAGRLELLRQQAQADTARVQQYRISNNLPSMTGSSLTEQEISSYNQGVAEARAQAAEDEARLATAKSQLSVGSSGDKVGEAVASPVVSALRSQRSEVSARLAALEVQFGPRYPDVGKARGELRDIDAQISAEINRTISSLEAKARTSEGRLESIEGSLNGARGRLMSNNRAMVGLDDLTRRAEASQQLYDTYLAQYKETLASQGTERPDARVTSYAELPTSPVSPRPVLNIILALIIGSGVGVVVGLVREMLFSGLSTAADVENRLHISSFGSVPLLKSVLPDAASPRDAILHSPRSAFTEAFRGIRTSIRYAAGGPPQVLMVTSALPREGKTTISACLSQMCALNGERVVVVDVDPRQRGTSRLLRNALGPGLLQVLRGEAPLDDALVQDMETGAWILPICGPVGDLGYEIVGDGMSKLLAELRQRFSLILLDAAPVLPIADTRALAAKVDGVILIVRWRATPDHALKAALQLLPFDVVRIAGIVLSQVDVRKQARYGYGDSALYYEKYEHYYG